MYVSKKDRDMVWAAKEEYDQFTYLPCFRNIRGPGWGGGVLNSLFNKNIDINSVFGKYKVNTIKYDISKYLFDKM